MDKVIVSGGARGIDFEAHMGCLRAKGQTIAFLPGGLQSPYPRSHHFLFKQILEQEGLLVSEFISTDQVRKENFYQRNRLIAGVSEGVVIVEAALKSGTWMTAHKAMSENRDLFIVPGSPLLESYEGSMQLIREGASVMTCAKDLYLSQQIKLPL
jgi:DNA processing protein